LRAAVQAQPNWSFAFRVAAARNEAWTDFDASYLLIEKRG
jgi:hypothetical protein